MAATDTRQKILIVDDESTNLTVLRENLKTEYNLVFAKSGPDALTAVAKHRPHLILLDIMMSGMDGYEVCRRLKDDPAAADTPIIFITAMSGTDDEKTGLELGAVDYVTKPIVPEIVRARVRTQLDLLSTRTELEDQNEFLTKVLETREDMENIMRHDLKAPLTPIIGFPQLLVEEEDLDEKVRDALAVILDSGYRMLNIINISLDLAKMEHGTYKLQPQEIDLILVLRRVLNELSHQIDGSNVKVETRVDGDQPNDGTVLIWGEELLLHSVLSNLLKNAIEASPKHGTINIDIESKSVTMRLRNEGEVPEELRRRFFEKYATAGKKGGTGLGTFSARLVIETLGGGIELDSAEEGATTIVLELPRCFIDSGEKTASNSQ